jgi:hypothetical protein
MKINELLKCKPNPIIHQSLTMQQQKRAKILFNKIQGLNICNSFEQWELGFLRSNDPENEIKAWEWITSEFEKNQSKNLDITAKKKAITELLLLSAKEYPLGIKIG